MFLPAFGRKATAPVPTLPAWAPRPTWDMARQWLLSPPDERLSASAGAKFLLNTVPVSA